MTLSKAFFHFTHYSLHTNEFSFKLNIIIPIHTVVCATVTKGTVQPPGVAMETNGHVSTETATITWLPFHLNILFKPVKHENRK